jgi:RecA-family ATPase
VILFGNPGDLKTMFCQDLALCVAAGKPWLEGLPGQGDVEAFHCQQTPALWVDCDNGLDRTERRFAALGKALGIPVDAPLAYISFPVPPFVASSKKSIDRIVDAAIITDARLIIIDYLGAISGGADENSAEMIRVMSGLRWIAETTGAVVVVIHHKTKADKTRAGHSLRGHSSIEGAVDLALLIEREEGADSITVKSTKSRDALVEPFEALWTYESDGRDLVAGRFYGLGAAESVADGERQQAREAILEILEEKPGLSQTALMSAAREETDMGKGIVLFALKQLVKEGKVSKSQGERKHWFSYNLAEI